MENQQEEVIAMETVPKTHPHLCDYFNSYLKHSQQVLHVQHL